MGILKNLIGRVFRSKYTWVTITDHDMAEEETRKMMHAVVHYFDAGLPDARFYSLRDKNGEPVATAMFTPHNRSLMEQVIVVGPNNKSPMERRKEIEELGVRLGYKLVEVLDKYPYARWEFDGSRLDTHLPPETPEAWTPHFTVVDQGDGIKTSQAPVVQPVIGVYDDDDDYEDEWDDDDGWDAELN